MFFEPLHVFLIVLYIVFDNVDFMIFFVGWIKCPMICFGQTWSREIKMFSGLEDLNFPSTNETQQIEETATEVQGIDMEGGAVASHPRSSMSNSKRSKSFDPKEDLVVVSAWLNVGKDPVH